MAHPSRGLAVPAVVTALVAAALSGCVRTTGGAPVAGGASATTATPPTGSTQTPGAPPDQSSFGVVPTSRHPIPAKTVTCAQPDPPLISMYVFVDDPGAPRVTVGVPDGWSMSSGTGDVGGRIEGPNGMTATVSITPTDLEPAEAFDEYADNLMRGAAVSSVSVLPGELCDYSGQKLIGAWSDTPQNAVEYRDRIVHIWTNGGDYLVAVHAEAPTGTAGFEAAATVLTADFAVEIP